MKKFIITAAMAIAMMAGQHMAAQKVVPIKFGDMDHWVTRIIKESGVIGGQTKHVYEIGPTQTINGAKAYTNLGGSPWGSSNVYAKVMGVVKTSNAVFPDTHGHGKCAKLTTMLEHVKAIGVINMDVLVSGSIFLGQMIEPLSSTKNPYSKMEMGIPYKQRPKYLQFDYKLNAPAGDRTYSSGFGSKKTIRGRDYAEVFIILQRRWEDEKGNIYAHRLGTVFHRFSKETDWVNGAQFEIHYGDITGEPFYKPYMNLFQGGEDQKYAVNSKGKVVKVKEVGWGTPDEKPTHLCLQFASSFGTAYVGAVGTTFWLDNVKLVY